MQVSTQHITREDFGARLRSALIDTNTETKYGAIRVVLHYWDDDNTHAKEDAETIGDYFKDTHGAEVIPVIWLAQTWRAPLPRIGVFADDLYNNTTSRSLLVWVYVGHGRLDNRTLYLGNATHAPTSDIVLLDAENSLTVYNSVDILVIFDCCHVAASTNSRTLGNARLEVLSAAGENQRAFGRNSFSYRFIEAMKDIATPQLALQKATPTLSRQTPSFWASGTQERIISINNTAPARSTALIAVHLVEDIQPEEMIEWVEQVTTALYSHGSIQVKAVEKEYSTIVILSVPVFILLPLLPSGLTSVAIKEEDPLVSIYGRSALIVVSLQVNHACPYLPARQAVTNYALDQLHTFNSGGSTHANLSGVIKDMKAQGYDQGHIDYVRELLRQNNQAKHDFKKRFN
ncbi:hypothetical protein PROFUN_15405 [Planoprotostelium fungivorum]|uniref:Uncharacterized protein n=1 Tax=Planoprotostelium fungivorum TaxID=1890364 RepID=A0A2P6MVH1_9EUKA|nr:hypothetical protein PROFUN_15405 [Planoprotostelium fungivorum]